MDKEEILKKSRQENDISDERTKYIGLSKSQTHRRRADNTQDILLWLSALLILVPIDNNLPRPTGKEKNRCRAG